MPGYKITIPTAFTTTWIVGTIEYPVSAIEDYVIGTRVRISISNSPLRWVEGQIVNIRFDMNIGSTVFAVAHSLWGPNSLNYTKSSGQYVITVTGEPGATGPYSYTGSIGPTGATGPTGLGYDGFSYTYLTSAGYATDIDVNKSFIIYTELPVAFFQNMRVRVYYTPFARYSIDPTNYFEGTISALTKFTTGQSLLTLTISKKVGINQQGTRYATWVVMPITTEGYTGSGGGVGYDGSQGEVGYTGSRGSGFVGSAGLGYGNTWSTSNKIIQAVQPTDTFITFPVNNVDAFIPGNYIRTVAADTIGSGWNSDYYMEGRITEISSNNITMLLEKSNGVDEQFNFWQIQLAGLPGSTGGVGYTGSTGAGYTGSQGYGFSNVWASTSVSVSTVPVVQALQVNQLGGFSVGQRIKALSSLMLYGVPSSTYFNAEIIGTTPSGPGTPPIMTVEIDYTNNINDPYNYWLITLTGEQGISGFTGSQGEIGYHGSVGYTGSAGEVGYTGSTGEVGYVGSASTEVGYTGSKGGVGYTGSQGEVGYTGSAGEVGYTGSEGGVGYTGSQGEVGYAGSQGEVGYTGSQGEVGYTGSQGEVGYTGSQGEVGYTGSQGEVGYKGSRGIGFAIWSDTVQPIPSPLPTTVTFEVEDPEGFVIGTDFRAYGSTAPNTQFIYQDEYMIGYITDITGSGNNYVITADITDSKNTILNAIFPYFYIALTGSKGASGYAGSQGEIGYTGSEGEVGYTGSEGIGYTGSASEIPGYTGSQGEVGYTGSKGFGYDVITTSPPTLYTDVNLRRFITFQVNYLGAYYQGTLVRVSETTSVNSITPKFFEGKIFQKGQTGLQYGITIIVSNTNWNFDTDVLADYPMWNFSTLGGLGYTGSQGVGYSGSQGNVGYSGSQGDQGIPGFTGSMGPPQGYTGSAGSVGFVGSRGFSGFTGSAGTGFTGSRGNLGYTGSGGSGSGGSLTVSNVRTVINNTVGNSANVGLLGGRIRLTGNNFSNTMELMLSTITSANIVANTSMQLVDANNIDIDIPGNAAGKYHLTLVENDGRNAIKFNAVNYVNTPGPTWVTSQQLPNQTIGEPTYIILQATGAVEYSLKLTTPLPTGLTFSSNGVISGNMTGITSANYRFNISAINSQFIETPRIFYMNHLPLVLLTWTNLPNPLGSTGFPLQSIVNATISNVHYRIAVSGSIGSLNGRVITSGDGGITWTERTSAATAVNNTALWAAGPKLAANVDANTVPVPVVIVAGDNGKLAYTTNISIWTGKTISSWPSTAGVREIVYSHAYKLYLLAGTLGAVAISSDGISWTYTNSLASWASWASAQVWTLSVDRLGRIWAGGDSGKLAYTTTGTSWTLEPIMAANAWSSGIPWTGENVTVILFGPQSGMVIAGSQGSIAYPSGGWQWADNITSIRQNSGGGWVSGCVIGSTFYLISSTKIARSSDNGKSWTISDVGSGNKAMVGPILFGPINTSWVNGQRAEIIGSSIYFSEAF